MIYRALVDLVVTVHFAFLLFVVLGGLVARRYRWLVVPHLCAAAWGTYVEAMPGLICPLTSLENLLALKAGAAGYQTGFIEQYLGPIIYPDGLTPIVQRSLAAVVIVINVIVYTWPRSGGRQRSGRTDLAERDAA